MHSKWNSLGLLAFVVLMVVFEAEASESSRTNSVLWGEIREGLQLGVEPDNRAGVIHCWIRNGLTNDVYYNDYYLGVAGLVKLEIWFGESWKSIRFNRGYVTLLSAGPSVYGNQVVASQEVIRTTSRKHMLLPMRPQPSAVTTIVTMNKPLSNVPTINFGGEITNHPFYKAILSDGTVTIPQNMPVISTNDSTYAVDMLYLKWPIEALSQKTLRMRITQSLCKPLTNGVSYNPQQFELQSPPFEMSMEPLQTFLRKAGSVDSVEQKK